MADNATGEEGRAKASDPADEWRLANERRRGYAVRMFKANAAGVIVAVVITGAILFGLSLVLEGSWDGSRPITMGRGLALLAMPGILSGIWVRNKLKVPNSR